MFPRLVIRFNCALFFFCQPGCAPFAPCHLLLGARKSTPRGSHQALAQEEARLGVVRHDLPEGLPVLGLAKRLLAPKPFPAPLHPKRGGLGAMATFLGGGGLGLDRGLDRPSCGGAPVYCGSGDVGGVVTLVRTLRERLDAFAFRRDQVSVFFL